MVMGLDGYLLLTAMAILVSVGLISVVIEHVLQVLEMFLALLVGALRDTDLD